MKQNRTRYQSQQHRQQNSQCAIYMIKSISVIIMYKIEQIQALLELSIKFMKNGKTKSANYNQERMKDFIK